MNIGLSENLLNKNGWCSLSHIHNHTLIFVLIDLSTMRFSLISVLLAAATAIATPIDAANKLTGEKASSSSYSNDLADCKPLIMIYARGTWEPGTPPSQVAAPLIKALGVKYPGRVESQIVQYDGGASGYLTGGSTEGIQKMEQMTKAAVSRCPNSKFLLVGYSQGAQVLHKAVGNLPQSVTSHINAIVVFGDPFKGQPIKNIPNQIIHTECYPNDNVCNGLPLPIGAHNEYDKRVDAVTEWIVQTLGNL